MKPRILIIDAHPVYVLRTIGFLESLTLKDNLVVSRGDLAMETIIANNPDIVILSATMPNTDIMALARQIKAYRPTLPVIVQTGLLIGLDMIKEFRSLDIEYILPRREKDWAPLEEAVTAILSAVKS